MTSEFILGIAVKRTPEQRNLRKPSGAAQTDIAQDGAQQNGLNATILAIKEEKFSAKKDTRK